MKKFTAAVLACSLMCSAVPAMTLVQPAAAVAAATEADSLEYLSYVEASDGIVITGLKKSTVTDLVIPKQIDHTNVVSIGVGAFLNATNLKSIVLPEKLRIIDNYAFEGCTALEKVVLPDSLESIGSFAFQDCISLESIDIPNDVKIVAPQAFDGCLHLTELTLPSGISEVYQNTVSNCPSLEKVIISNGPTVIRYAAFANCEKLKTIEIPTSIRNIECFETEVDKTPCFVNCPVERVYYTGSSLQWDKITDAEKSFGDINVLFSKKAPTLESKYSICDVNRDGKVDSTDASEVLGYYAYISTGGKGSYEDYKALEG